MHITEAKRACSLGAGWQSSLMAIKYNYDEIIFSDVGEESKETYEWLYDYLIPYLENIGKTVTIVSRPITHDQPNLYDFYMQNNGIPTRQFRSCTDKFKIQVIRKYLREKYGKDQKFIMDLGITLDEYHRMKDSDVKYITNNFPLIEDRYTAKQCAKELREIMNLPDNYEVPRSGCTFCPYEKPSRFIENAQKDEELKDRVLKLENNALKHNSKLFLYNKPLYKIFDMIDREQPMDKWFDQECDGGYCFV